MYLLIICDGVVAACGARGGEGVALFAGTRAALQDPLPRKPGQFLNVYFKTYMPFSFYCLVRLKDLGTCDYSKHLL